MRHPLFICFEGGEAAGKTTQAHALLGRLTACGQEAVLVHEPGSTELGWALRGILKGHASITAKAELLLFAAARAELVQRVILPTLESGKHVIADRYAYSTEAYQGRGRGLDIDQVRLINQFATGSVLPDLVFLLDLPPGATHGREAPLQLALHEGGETPEQPAGRIQEPWQRRFEQETVQFHRRVREAYLRMAQEDPGRWTVIQGTAPQPEIEETVWEKVLQSLEARRLDVAEGGAGGLAPGQGGRLL